MSTRSFIAAFGLAVALAPAAFAATPINLGASVDKAIEACSAANRYGPVEVAGTVADGMGDWLIWIKDKDSELWLCNASEQGAVYANIYMEGDLLRGSGAELIGFQTAANRNRTQGPAPATTAESLCSAIGGYIEDMTIVATVEDGMGDYLIWLKNANEQLWLCNASADAKLYSFEPVDLPLNEFEPINLRNA
jgi:hypothetical protein